MISSKHRIIFHRTTILDRRMAGYCIGRKEKLEIPKNILELIKDEFYKSKDDIVVFEQATYGQKDIDNDWFIAYNTPEEIHLYEITDELMEETNYGIGKKAN